MGLIDVAIPAIIGTLLLLSPVKASGDAEKDAKTKQRLRLSGSLLLGVAVVYLLLKVAQGKI